MQTVEQTRSREVEKMDMGKGDLTSKEVDQVGADGTTEGVECELGLEHGPRTINHTSPLQGCEGQAQRERSICMDSCPGPRDPISIKVVDVSAVSQLVETDGVDKKGCKPSLHRRWVRKARAHHNQGNEAPQDQIEGRKRVLLLNEGNNGNWKKQKGAVGVDEGVLCSEIAEVVTDQKVSPEADEEYSPVLSAGRSQSVCRSQ